MAKVKMRALGDLSGAVGDVPKGQEFEVDRAVAKDLVERKVAVEVEGAASPASTAETTGKKKE